MKTDQNTDPRFQQVQDGYTQLLRQSEKKTNGLKTSSCCGGYSQEDATQIPAEALQSSFGCGNPLKFAEVQAGQTVLDIGSGAGIDCFIAAEKVGIEGQVIGLDMTPAMILKAQQIAASKGYENVEFRLGRADQMPVESNSVDWVISNCVINLAPDKPAVFREAYRVLKPGGRVSISDIVLGVDLPKVVRDSLEAYVGCLAGAIREEEYLEAMRQAGLTQVEVTSRLVYDTEQMRSLVEETAQTKTSCCSCGSTLDPYLKQFAGQVWSAEIKAMKPV